MITQEFIIGRDRRKNTAIGLIVVFFSEKKWIYK